MKTLIDLWEPLLYNVRKINRPHPEEDEGRGAGNNSTFRESGICELKEKG